MYGLPAAAACWWVVAAAATSPPLPRRGPRPPAAPGPMLEQRTVTFEPPDLDLVLVRSSQIVAAVKTRRPIGWQYATQAVAR